ncbi:MAG: NADH-quinone oxidoreductase subunit J [Acidimicrobiia bacterium]|nr:NADH-quinone oxidoreductase subunit J [Acidimicrobiia bacterium]
MADVITFYTLAALILIFGLLVVTTRNTVHSVLFLVADFLAVAMLYASMNSLFVAAIQVLVYAGGIVVLYLFVVMLVNLKRPPEEVRDPARQTGLGGVLAGVVLAELALIAVANALDPPATDAASSTAGLTEQVGLALYTDYLIPFEVASVLLLVAMVGAIVLARREL